MSAAPHMLFQEDDREIERQAALDRYAIVDTAPEQAFDDIVRLAATLCDVPAAAITLIDHERLWFKARIGIDQPALPRAQSLCAHAIDEPDRTLMVEDLASDPNHARRRRIGGRQIDQEFLGLCFSGDPLRTEHAVLDSSRVKDAHEHHFAG